MKLSIETLAAHGGFVSRKPVEKEVTLKNEGEKVIATVYVLPLSYATVKSDMQALHAQGDVMAGRIASCIVNEDGSPVFTVEDVIGTADPERGPLSDALTSELLRVISEVNSVGKTPASSTTSKKSGTSSSSQASVAGRSRKRKSASATASS